MRALGFASLCGLFAFGGCTTDEDVGPASDPPAPEVAAKHHVPAPRLIAPLSTTHVTTKLPTLSWTLGHRQTAHVEICADRPCTQVLAAFDVDGTSVQPTEPLPDGVLFWRVFARDRHGRSSPPSATWELWTSGLLFPQPGLAGPPADTTYASVLDVNGDGAADLAVGAPGSTAGLVHLYLGGPGGPPATPSQTLAGPARFGAALASAGDVNGDGYADLAVATAGGAGAVQIFYGGAAGLGVTPVTLGRGAVTAQFGATLSTAQDVDGDGYADLLVGGLEVAQIYRGGAAGLATAPARALRGDDAIDPAQAPNATRVDGGADVNGDRIPDVMVAGWSYLGTASGYAIQPEHRFLDGHYVGDQDGDGLTDYAGYEVNAGSPAGLRSSGFAAAGQYFFGAAGDTNGDGFFDLIASVSSLTGLPPWRAYYGNPLGGTDGPQNAVSFPAGQPTHDTWAAAGDLDGDTLEDVAVGVPADGAVYLFMAPDVPSTPTRVLTGPGEGFGAAVE